MLRVIVCALIFLLPLSAGLARAEDDQVHDETVYVPEDDPAMQAAIATARATLPEFWLHFTHPGEGEENFNLKVGLTEGGQVEHVWCDDIIGDMFGASCVIANDTEIIQSAGLGDRITVDPDAISDWMYVDHGKIRGARTLRAMLPHLSREEAAQYEELLLDR